MIVFLIDFMRRSRNKPATGVAERRRRWRSYRTMDTGFRSWHREQLGLQPSVEQIPHQTQHTAVTSPRTSTLVQYDISPGDGDDEQLPSILNASDPPLDQTSDGYDSTEQPDEPLQGDHALSNAFNISIEDPLVSPNPREEAQLQVDSTTESRISNVAGLGSILSGRNMIALSLVKGTTGLTAEHYQCFRWMLLDEFYDNDKLPSYNTLLYSLRPALSLLCISYYCRGKGACRSCWSDSNNKARIRNG